MHYSNAKTGFNPRSFIALFFFILNITQIRGRNPPFTLKNLQSEPYIMQNNNTQTIHNGLESALSLNTNAINSPVGIWYNASPFLLSLNYIPLANTYKSNSFAQTVVDLPVADAFRDGGYEIDSKTLSADQLTELVEFMADKGDNETIKDCLRWGRLYGGGLIAVNTEQKPDTPFNPATIKGKEVELIALDRWQMYPLASSLQLAEQFILQDTLREEQGNGIIFDKSRVMTYTGKTQPYYLRNLLQGWGASVFEDVVPQLNQYLKANSVVLELLDEAKIDVLKISGLSELLGMAEGEQLVRKRIEIAATNKNYKGMLAMDANDDYQQKQLSFGSLDGMVEKIFLMICAACRIPYSKIFGRGASGFSSGEDDLENYNAMINTEIRIPAERIIKKVIDIRCFQLFGRKVPDLVINWKPLRVLDEKAQQEVNNLKVNSYIQLMQAQVLTPKQVAEKLTNDKIVLFSEEEIKALKDDFEPEEMPERVEEVEETVNNSFWDKFKRGGSESKGFFKALNFNPYHDEKGRFCSCVNKNFKKELQEILEKAKNNPNERQKLIVGKVSKDLEKKAKQNGFNIAGFNHDLDVSGIRHAFKEHGETKTEEPRGQIAIEDTDFERIPDIIYKADEINFTGVNKTGLETITYKKVFNDGTIFYVEEIRNGKKTLTINTMYKHKKS